MYKMQNIFKKHIKASLKTCQILPLKKKKECHGTVYFKHDLQNIFYDFCMLIKIPLNI